MKKITIKDIARHVGVTPMTVSNVINGKLSRVSEQTKESIDNAIRELNYIPNYSARILVKKESKLIGFFIPHSENSYHGLLVNPFYSHIISGIEQVCRRRGFHLIISGVDKNTSSSNISVERNLDGVILLGVLDENLLSGLERLNVPIVLIDSYIKGENTRSIGIDDENGGYMATKYLLDNGHKKIAIVNGEIIKNGVTEKRYNGYKRAMKEKGFFDRSLVYEGNVSFEYGYEAGNQITNDISITAVFAAADIIAFGVIKAVFENSKSVPEDLSVVGFDDVMFASMMQAPLTTIRQDIFMKGFKACEMLLDEIEKDSNAVTDDLTLPIELIERKSVKNLV